MATQTLRTAFWNVENLFDPACNVGRGPTTPTELNAKIQRLADCINNFYIDANGSPEPPALIGLAEVHTENILKDLISRLLHPFHYIWHPANYPNQTGLGVLYRDPVLAAVEVACQTIGRPRYLLIRCNLQDSRAFLFGVNHWKSRLVTHGVDDHKDRLATASQLRAEIQNQQDGCVVLMGDFNADPTEEYFGELHLRGTQHFSKALSCAARVNRLYNTGWRFLTEPRSWEEHKANINVEQRPKTTHCDRFVIWDQALVSGYALKGIPLRLIEKSVGYYHGPDNAKHNNAGVLKPVRWDYNGGAPQGASDHFPLLAEFEIM